MQDKNTFSWATKLTDSEFSELIESSSLISYNKNETIIKQGSLASQILVLEEGFVKLNLEIKGKDSTFGFSVNGDFIGLMCSFVIKKLDFSAIAVTTSKVRIFDRNIFEKLIKENGEFALDLISTMSEMTNSAIHNLLIINHRNVNGALALLLLRLHKLFNSKNFSLPFTREEMARSLAYSKESIINTLSDFQKDEIIKVSGKNISILKLESLKLIAENG
ncbi:MAG: Crp/Fnr family transcriptional regulator [Bacteroidales bacterium]|jgi:CRP-like cAMP-binding protein|nr:Crp/Fnr family transcriptional regulator [Bacteroidales bacterium]MCK9499688.1 Crp/Fnr family transcriptional regulator [Bacteroidales bacterium]MDY0314872.1 Crp/Fnr family transcriptional regulator [Bacteroidales bacterium]NLB87269.1 Crp/Fnr family transcriptional regulator [Bacteroidales bacterium]